MSKEFKKEFISWTKTIIFALILAILINKFIIVNATVPTGSMEDTIMPKDRIIAFRPTYFLSSPDRGDIVIFKYPDNEDVLYVKRIIGLPNETIEIIDGEIYVNGSETPLEENYLNEEPLGSFGPYEVPEDSYFMMGDNRNRSEDSRFWQNTFVSEDKILGKVFLRYFPKITIIK